MVEEGQVELSGAGVAIFSCSQGSLFCFCSAGHGTQGLEHACQAHPLRHLHCPCYGLCLYVPSKPRVLTGGTLGGGVGLWSSIADLLLGGGFWPEEVATGGHGLEGFYLLSPPLLSLSLLPVCHAFCRAIRQPWTTTSTNRESK